MAATPALFPKADACPPPLPAQESPPQLPLPAARIPHYETVKSGWEDRFERRYGFWRGLHVAIGVDQSPSYDVTPDGKRVIMARDNEVAPVYHVNIVLDWLDELKRLVPTDN